VGGPNCVLLAAPFPPPPPPPSSLGSFRRTPFPLRELRGLRTYLRTVLRCSVLGKLKVALLERAGLLERTGPPSQWEAEEAPIVPGPKGAVDPKKVVLHKMVARGTSRSTVAAIDACLE
jgi:hypothetical protein